MMWDDAEPAGFELAGYIKIVCTLALYQDHHLLLASGHSLKAGRNEDPQARSTQA